MSRLETTFINAAKKGNIKKIKELVKSHPVLVNATDQHGRASLHYAAEGNYLTVANFLIRHGAEIDAQDERGMSSLHLAMIYDDDIAAKLIENNGDLNLADIDGNTPTHIAALTCCSNGLSSLHDAGADIFIKNKKDLSPWNIIQSMNMLRSVYDNNHGCGECSEISACHFYSLKVASAKMRMA